MSTRLIQRDLRLGTLSIFELPKLFKVISKANYEMETLGQQLSYQQAVEAAACSAVAARARCFESRRGCHCRVSDAKVFLGLFALELLAEHCVGKLRF